MGKVQSIAKAQGKTEATSYRQTQGPKLKGQHNYSKQNKINIGKNTKQNE